jgi:hypothetical protein
MAVFLTKYKTDEVAETDGKWFDLGDNVQVKVVRMDNPQARKLRNQLNRPYQGRTIPEDKLDDIINKVMAQTVVKDWKNVTDENGNEVPFTPETAFRLFKKFPDFRDDVGAFAADREQFRADALEADAGNLSTPSDGT